MYRSILTCVIIVLVPRTSVFCFNFEHRDPLVKKAPDDQKNSYFGFSVAQHKTYEFGGINDSWLLVGAPLGQNLQPGSNRSGALFKCPISTYDDDCTQVETDGKGAGRRYIYAAAEDYGEEMDQSLSPPASDEIKDGQWLGVSVRSQKAGGTVLVCAHRYIQSQDLSKFHYGQGLCYLMEADLKISERLQLCNGRPMDKLHQQFGFCQIGTSISFVGDDFAMVGAPGPYTWRGTAFGKVVVGDFLTKDKTIYHGPFGDVDIIEKYSYLGMSVGGGNFFDKSEYIYIAGAPRSKLIGEVYFFKKYTNEEEFNITLIITGEQLASSFGYEVLAVDVNNDGYDDLLVGAPFYYGEGRGGAVYVYYNLRNCTFAECKWNKVYYGKPQSRFGFSMTSVGDINKDGYNDVAIGAPYEDDHGTVYIYLGSANGLNEEPSQIISIPVLKTLGYSLSGGMDMDDNGYPDLLVGAYESEKILLFKTRPIIDIRIKIKSNELKNINATKKGCPAEPNSNYTCFSFESCFTVGGNLKKGEKFNVNYHITEEKRRVSRIWFQDDRHPDKRSSEYQTVIAVSNYRKEYCHSQLVKIKDSVSDILSPMKFKVNYTLENDKFHSPILNKTSVKIFDATFQKECGDDDNCESYLILKANTNLHRIKNMDNTYQLDKVNEDFILKTKITNKGEPAYEAKLYVFHPSALSYIAVNTDANYQGIIKCSTSNDTLVVCDVGNPFHGNRTVNLEIRFEVNKETKLEQLTLNMLVNSTSTELSKETTQSVTAILNKIAKFQIRGKASSNLFYGGKVTGEIAMEHLEDIGARVTHKYQIDNNGQWDLTDIKVNIKWPLQVTPGEDRLDQPGKWLLYLESVPVISGFTGIQGYCEVLNGRTVNELNLTVANNSISEEPENLVLPEDYVKPNDSMTYITRRKRSVDYVVESETVKKSGSIRKVIYMDCNKGTAKCIDIVCTIRKLKRGNQADIDIRSRIWNSTLVEDYSKVDWVSIKSHAIVEITDKSFNISSESIREFSAETVAFPLNVTASTLNWWIIGGAALAGILLLIILIVILYRCGFFKRKRYNKEHKGNIQKKSEADQLLNDNGK